jgi:hypothetical protein
MTIPKIIVTLTTTPKRMPLIEKTIMSILNQNVKPHKIIVNIPPIFKRTGELYADPHVLFKDKPDLLNDDIIVWNKKCKDVGPITKLVGCLKMIDEKDDVWIVTIDDDICYLQYTLELYLCCITRIREKNAYGIAGFLWENGCIIRNYQNNFVHILEGYARCCYHRSFFPKPYWNSYLKQVLDNKNCIYNSMSMMKRIASHH